MNERNNKEMNLKHLSDQTLLSQTKRLVENERELLTEILHHLKEVEKRKLFSDLGYKSLFEYTVKELKYSEGQAGRRIQAMRLIKEIPEVEDKIKNGSLSLSNVSQAQSYFREMKKAKKRESLFFQAGSLDHQEVSLNQQLEKNDKGDDFDDGLLKDQENRRKTKKRTKEENEEDQLSSQTKLEILKKLENKSSREGQKVLLSLQKEKPLPKEKERLVSATHTEVRFVINEDLKKKLEEVRSLLGPKGSLMSFSDLVEFMAGVSAEQLKIKKFGKKRALNVKEKKSSQMSSPSLTPAPEPQSDIVEKDSYLNEQILSNNKSPATERKSENRRYISASLKHHIWMRDQGKCQNCGSKRNLQWDHIHPLAFGGKTMQENLRLLCFHCNQRQAMKKMGMGFIHGFRKKDQVNHQPKTGRR